MPYEIEFNLYRSLETDVYRTVIRKRICGDVKSS